MYRPLPQYLTIQSSKIEGLGLFSTKPIAKGTILGISHHFINDEIIRTPLGGFYNHSEDPNCYSIIHAGCAELATLRNIKAGEELTTFYSINPLSSCSSIG